MTGKKSRVDRRRQRVRDDILGVTRRLVLEHGLGAVTLAAIADELELTKPALYYYFKSKDDLLFEVMHGLMVAEMEAIGSGLEASRTGAQALEAIIRGCAGHYENNLDVFRLAYLASQVGKTEKLKPEHLARIRPLNDLVYGRAERLLKADQVAGIVRADIDARRTAFVAHSATIGLLTHESMVDAGDDSPLIHSHADLVDTLVEIHVSALSPRVP